MKQIILGIALVTLTCCCSKEETTANTELYSPKVSAFVKSLGSYTSPSIPLGDTTFTGVLEVYPCVSGTTDFYGNYNGTQLTSFYPVYTIENGYSTNAVPPVWLPAGNYNMVYWGVTLPQTGDYLGAGGFVPPLPIGTNLSLENKSLRETSPGSNIYMPTYNSSFAVTSVNIGTDSLSAHLTRVVGILNLTVENTDGSIFDPSITEMNVIIGGIAKSVGFTSGTPSSTVCNVTFPITKSTDNLKWGGLNAMLFPSTPNPLLTLNITLANGSVKTFQQNLTKSIVSGYKLNLKLLLNSVTSKETGTSLFTITKWIETTEEINVPPLT